MALLMRALDKLSNKSKTGLTVHLEVTFHTDLTLAHYKRHNMKELSMLLAHIADANAIMKVFLNGDGPKVSD